MLSLFFPLLLRKSQYSSATPPFRFKKVVCLYTGLGYSYQLIYIKKGLWHSNKGIFFAESPVMTGDGKVYSCLVSAN